MSFPVREAALWVSAFTIIVASSGSCAMILDFDDGNTPLEDGGGGSGVGGEGGEGGAEPSGSWVSQLVAVEGSGVFVQAIEVREGITWMSGYFTGPSLSSKAGDAPTELVLDVHTDEPALDAVTATTFVIAIDDAGAVAAKIPLASSRIDDIGADDFLGTKFAFDDSGDLYVLSTIRDGETLWPGAAIEAEGLGWNLLVIKLAAEALDAEPAWATRCTAAAVPLLGNAPNMGARFGDIALLEGSTLAIATTIETSAGVECSGVVNEDEAPAFELPSREDRVLIGAVARFDGDAGSASEAVEFKGGNNTSVWVDQLVATSGSSVLVTGKLSDGEALDPWDDPDLPSTAVAFAGIVDLANGAADSLETFASEFQPIAPSGVDTFAVSVLNTPVAEEQALDIHLTVAGVDFQFGDPQDKIADEVVRTLSISGTEVLIGGELTADDDLAKGLCGEGCSGELVSDSLACEAQPEASGPDAFWMLLDTSSPAPLTAMGRSFGDCAAQSVVASALSPEAITLVAHTSGTVLVDVLDDHPRRVEAPHASNAVLVIHISRPPLAE